MSNPEAGGPPLVVCPLYSLPSIIRMVMSMMRWAGHVARMGGCIQDISGKARKEETTRKTKMSMAGY
jgi:hypothetical protein